MEKMINLRDLLVHEIQDLYSAEEQIIEGLPAMIEKANNKQLKQALQEHLKVTEQQKKRLDEVKNLLLSPEENGGNGQQKGLFSRLFGGGGSQKCRGVEGLIEEGEKVMGENMTPEVLDAAIIASAQKIEHYEICGYGTARAYARELNLGNIAELLEETLNEEYEADDLLTDLAVGRLNEEAQNAQEEGGEKGNGRGSRGRSNASGRSNGSNGSKTSGSRGAAKSASKKSSSSSSSSSRSNGSKSARSKSASKSSSGGRKSNGTAKKTGGSSSKSSSSKSRSSRAKSR